ncbi:putative Ig domain-containing protein [Agrobacterium salinitolerans]|nr:putative Ig domain-containing protein [Agrobacterium salinitolerans]
MLFTPVAQASVMNGNPGQIFFRYKTPILVASLPDDNHQTKDITAFYVGGVGYPFSEKLPMKSDWQDDDWRIVSGTLPDGISFDSSTQTFSGTPTAEGKGTVVELEGFDENGNSVATAAANFDVYTVQGTPVTVDLYAHTGKYKVDTLSIPAGITVDSWRRVYMPPDGIAVNGPYFEGTPTKAGVYPVFIQGINYMGEVVATYHGKYTVEDGPTFPHIPDDVRKLPQLEWGYGAWFNFGAPNPHKPNRLINPNKQAGYFLELETGEELPYGVASNQVSKNLNLQGYATKPYDTAKIRFKAIDSDATVGYSNWFNIGTSDPSPGCYPFYQGYPLTVKTGTPSKISVPRPFGAQGDVTYHLVSGTFPDGLGLNSATGQIEGTPLLAGEKTDINIRIDVTNGNNTVSTNCAYKMEVIPGGVRLSDATPEQLKHIRAGDVYHGTLNVIGGISPYSIEFKTPADWPTLAFTSPTQNTPSVTVSGPIDTAGNKTVNFVLNNGDTTKHDGRLTIYSHGPLDTGTVPTIKVQRLGIPQAWGSVPYDASTVIRDVKDQGKFPQFVLSNAGVLPKGIQLDAADFYGTTGDAVGTYGPFTVTMSDFSGQTKQSNQFNVEITPREEIGADTDNGPALTPPAFTVERDVDQTATPFRIKQPYGAKNFTITWTLNGSSNLPSWLSFDQTTGKMTATKGIPFADIGTYGPFTVTATDQENSAVTSEEFVVTARDWPTPDTAPIGQRQSNVSGDTSAGETATFVNIQNLKNYILEDTVIGGLNAVKFLSSDPVNPAGLNFNAADGSLTGVPTEEYNGDVSITFEDARQRRGTMIVPLNVIAYPSVAMEAQEFELPRLSAPADATPAIAAKTLNGFWNAARFEWDSTSTPLPAGLTVASIGILQGKSDAAAGTVVSGIRLLAKTTAPDGNTLVTRTEPFTIQIGDAKPVTLSYTPATATYRLEDKSGSYTLADKTAATPNPGGSYVTPLTYTLDQSQAIADGMTGTIGVNATNGTITGMPDRLGKWTVFVNLKDAEGRTISAPVPVTIWATLYGYVERSDGGDSKTLRAGEPFATDPISISKFVGTPIFSTTPAALPPSPVFDATTGAFMDDGAFAEAGNYDILVNVRDADGRTFDPTRVPHYTYYVLRPLEVSVSAASRSVPTRQYSANEGDPIDVGFSPSIRYQIGNIRYDLSGTLPGTLARKVYDKAGAFLHYAYTDAYGTARQETDAAKLPLDALVFDTIEATLKGIPSQAGTFGGIRLVASDDHQDDYIKSVPSKKTNNTASSEEITINVAPAIDFTVANMVGKTPSNEETAYQHTTEPTLRSVPSNAAYGKAPTWTAVSGQLPQGVGEIKGNELSYSGYPEVKGTFSDIVWKATDAAGRSVNTQPATIKVEPRKELELVATNPVGLVVNDTVANVAVTPRFSAYGRAIPQSDWTVTGVSNLPPGITHAIENNRVVFAGTATVIGTYKDVVVSAVDSLGSRASINLTFNVILPTDAIVLNVSNIKTKVDVPFEMQASSSNTYGKVRYYSYDITGGLADQLKLDPATGLVSGAFKSVQNLDFDVYVTDESNRVTTKPVLVEVMPDIRVTVPQIVELEPSTPEQQTIATDYILGTVAYEMGNPADWPVGITVDPVTGTINSDGTTPIGEYPNLTIVATDTFTRVGQAFVDRETSNVFVVKIDTNGPYVALTGGDLDPWSKRKSGYSQDLTADNFLDFKNIGLGEIAFAFPSQTNGKRFPPGLSISAGGLLTGTPTESGDFTFDVQASYKSNNKIKSVATYRMHIDLLPLRLELADTTLPGAESGKAYSFDFKPFLTAVNVPEAQVVWSKSNVDPDRPLPTGLTLSGNMLSGTPTGADDYEFKVKVSYTNNNPAVEKIDAERTFKLYVKKAAPYFIGSISNVSKAIKQPVTVAPDVGNKHSADVYSLVGSFPEGLFHDGGPIAPGDTAPGLMFDATTGVISGATKVSGEFLVQIKVTDKLGQSAVSNAFTLKFLNSVPTFVGDFIVKTGLERNVLDVQSNPILISGNTAAATATLTVPSGNAFFRQCTSALEAQTGTCTGSTTYAGNLASINSGTYVQVFLTTANTFATDRTATLDVSGVIRTFTVTTRGTDTVPDNLGEPGSFGGFERNVEVPSATMKVVGISDPTTYKLEPLDGMTYSHAYVYICAAGNATSGDCYGYGKYATNSTADGVERPLNNNTTIQIVARSPGAFSSSWRAKLTVGGVERIFTVSTRGTDTVPDNLGEPGSFGGFERNVDVPSATMKVEGITDATTYKLEPLDGMTYGQAFVYICATGNATSGDCYGYGKYSTNTAADSVERPLNNNTTIQIVAKSPGAFASSWRAKLTVGGVERIFTVSTRATDIAPDNLGEPGSIGGVERSIDVPSSILKIEGVSDPTTFKLEPLDGAPSTGLTVFLCAAGTGTSGDCFTYGRYASTSPGDGVERAIAANTYIQLSMRSAAAFGTTLRAKLTVGGVERIFSVATKADTTDLSAPGDYVDAVNVERNIAVYSNAIQIKGLPSGSLATISLVQGTGSPIGWVCANATYALQNNCYGNGRSKSQITSSTGRQVVNGDFIQIVATSANAFDTATVVKISVDGKDKPWTVTTRPTDTTPDDLGEFDPVANVERSAQVVSNVIRVTGITDQTTAAVEILEGAASARVYACHGVYANRKDCYTNTGYYRTSAMQGQSMAVNPGEALQFSVTSPGTFDTPSRVKVTVGGVERIFSVRTRPTNTTPANLGEFDPVANVERSAQVVSNVIRVTGITDQTTAVVEILEGAASARVYACHGVYAYRKDCYTNTAYYRTSAMQGQSMGVNEGEAIQFVITSAGTYDTLARAKVTVGGVERIFSVKTRPTDTTPDDLGELSTVADVERNTTVPSNTIKVTGITDTTTAKLELVEGVANATLYLCGATYGPTGNCYASGRYSNVVGGTGVAINVAPDSYLQVTVRSSAEYNTTARVKLTVGDVERFFDVKTRGIDTTPENLGTFRDVTNAVLNATVTSDAIQVADIKDTTPFSVSVVGSANATTKAFSCSATSGANGSCHINVYATATAGGAGSTILNEQFIVLQTKAAATPNTDVVVTVDVGGVLRTWTVRTAAQ